MKLYRISKGSLLQHDNASYLITQPWDELIGRDQLHDYLRQQTRWRPMPC